jgi:drug/metabolite transporter (DMT)-like permease
VVAGDTSRVSLLLYLEPVVSVAGAVILLGEHLTLFMISGGLLILAGVAAASTIGRQRARRRGARRRAQPPGVIRPDS